MALKNNPDARPDHKPVNRRGGTEEDTDVNMGTAASPVDIGSGGSGNFDSGVRNTGGAEAIAGEFESDDNNNFKVEIDWIDSNDNVVKTHAPSATNGVTDVEFSFRIRSDRWKLRVEDTSGANQNRVHGSANTH